MKTIESTLGADEFTFNGDRTAITYFPRTPGPIRVAQVGGEVRYSGPEGDHVFQGPEITNLDSPLGHLVSFVVRPDADMGAITVTLLVPSAIGVTGSKPVTFAAVAVKTTGRGFTATPGVDRTYDIIPLVGQALQVPLPL
jgi:hypothetical protein